METKEKNGCHCETGEFRVVSCSGASDLGLISDLTARRLRDNKLREMKCLSMIAIDDAPLIGNFKSANVLVIDGCPLDCGKKILEKAGISKFKHLVLTDLGYEKGKTPPTDAILEAVYEKASRIN